MNNKFYVECEISYKDDLKVYFTGYIGQRMDTIEYHDSSGAKVPFERILGKVYKYFKMTSVQGTRYEYDNLIMAKQNLIEVLIEHYQNFYKKELSRNTNLYKSARYIIDNNIVQENALTYLNNSNELIVFSEWDKREDKVRQLQFTFKSLVEHDFNAFSLDRQLELLDENKSLSDEFIKITKVYKNKFLGG